MQAPRAGAAPVAIRAGWRDSGTPDGHPIPLLDAMHPTRSQLSMAVVAFALAAAPAAGQEEPCEYGVIERIFVDNHSIFDTSDPDLDPRFRWAYRAANKLHVRTKESVIRRELLFEVGDCFDPVLVQESERMLRGYHFISRTDIYGIQQPGGGYHVVVDTEDEWSTQFEVRFDLSGDFELEGIEARERNFLGYGRQIGFFYQSREAAHSYGVRYSTPQLLGTRWDMDLSAGRSRAGTLLDQQITYPFVGEMGKWAFRQLFSRRDRLFDYVLPRTGDGPDRRILVPVREKAFHVASVWRAGRLGNLTVFGGGLSFQELSYPGRPATAITLVEGGAYDERVPAPEDLRLPAAARMEHLRNIRAVVLLGKRNIVWRQRRGLDSFRGEEDVRLGAEVEMAFARSLPGLESDDDLYGTIDVYAAAGPPELFFATRLRADARRDYDGLPDQFEMKDVFSEGEVLLYLSPSFLPDHTLLLRGAGAGGWHVQTPFQLTLGGERSLRGYAEEAFPGGRRLVLTAEDRWFWGWPFPDVVDLGSSVFADVGRIWPGEAPYGQDSGWRAAVGLGLRANFPAGGTNTLRIDAAFPIGPDGGLGKLQLLIGVGEYLGIGGDHTDPQFDRSRMPPITGTLLSFP